MSITGAVFPIKWQGTPNFREMCQNIESGGKEHLLSSLGEGSSAEVRSAPELSCKYGELPQPWRCWGTDEGIRSWQN